MDTQTSTAAARTASVSSGEPFVPDAATEQPVQSCSAGCGCGPSVPAMAESAGDAVGATRGRMAGWLIPASVFIAVWLGHFAWLGAFPEKCAPTAGIACAGESCAGESCELPPRPSLTAAYMGGQHQYLGFSYAASLAFATAAFGRYRRRRYRADRNLAIGGITVSSLLAIAGCFLVGCCGSPMLIVWLNLFGAKFLPLAKPLMAGVTVVSLSAAWLWMRYRERPVQALGATSL